MMIDIEMVMKGKDKKLNDFFLILGGREGYFGVCWIGKWGNGYKWF